MASQAKREFREGIDTALLILAFAGGIGSSVILKFMAFPPWVPALVAGAVIILYALLTYFSNAARLEPEQIGDNCYYLGFCITLASLAYTLYGLGTAGSDAAMLANVISGFGVALSSTVVGVMARVVLLQFRVDLAARDKEARSQLNQVMRSFHGEMQTSVSSTREAITQIQQTLDEHMRETIENNRRLQQSFEERINSLAEEAASGVKSVMSEVLDSGKDMNRRISASSRANISTAEKALQGSMETVTQDLKRVAEGLEDEMQRVNKTSLAALEQIVAEVSAAMKMVSTEATLAIESARNNQTSEMTKAVEAVGSNIFELANQIGAQKDNLGEAIKSFARQAEAAQHDANDLVRESAATREEARKSAQVITVASQKMAWATQKMEEVAAEIGTRSDRPASLSASQPSAAETNGVELAGPASAVARDSTGSSSRHVTTDKVSGQRPAGAGASLVPEAGSTPQVLIKPKPAEPVPDEPARRGGLGTWIGRSR